MAWGDYRWRHRAPRVSTHQRYLKWALMVTHHMRAHSQWQRKACTGVEEVHVASFHKASRGFEREYDLRVRGWNCHSYAQVGGCKSFLFAQEASNGAQQHLAIHMAR